MATSESQSDQPNAPQETLANSIPPEVREHLETLSALSRYWIEISDKLSVFLCILDDVTSLASVNPPLHEAVTTLRQEITSLRTLSKHLAASQMDFGQLSDDQVAEDSLC